MAEIRLDFAYPYRPDRVWTALTERGLLAAWLMENDFEAVRGHRFVLWPQDLPGLDGPIAAVVLDLAAPRRLTLGWQNGSGQAIVTVDLRPTRRGCKLRLTYAGDLGTADDPTQTSLTATLRSLFGQRLPVVLAPPDGPIRPRDRDRARLRLLAVICVIVPAATITGLVLLPDRWTPGGGAGGSGSGRLGGAPPTHVIVQVASGRPTAAPGQSGFPPGATAQPSPGGPSPSPPAPSPPAAVGQLKIGYSVTSLVAGSLSSVDVDVMNVGDRVVEGWTMTFGLSGLNLAITNVNGAAHTRRGPLHVFEPVAATWSVPAQGKVHFSFDVTGTLTKVTSCTVDDEPC